MHMSPHFSIYLVWSIFTVDLLTSFYPKLQKHPKQKQFSSIYQKLMFYQLVVAA